jgi:3-isopropylmalate dehydrogenase/3-benzylmalate dehydrogenase
MKQYRVVALPGEGIGPEVVEAALVILRRVAELHRFGVTIDYGLIGEPAFQQWGEFFPEATAQLGDGADGILFGAVSRGGLLELRKHFDFFANLRPVRPFASLMDRSPLKPEKLQGVDILFVRELVSGIYFGPAGRSHQAPDPYGYHTMRYTDSEIRRIARVALHQAQNRRQLLTVAHKENALPQLPWTRLVQAEAVDFPEVAIEPMLVDNLALQLMLQPSHFDVVLAGNLFGDILSDLGGALVGSIGVLGSASLNTQGFGLYEAVHGTAPDLAGKGMANPMGTLAGMTLMLQQWGEVAAADHLVQAQERLLGQGYCTADLVSQPGKPWVSTEAWITSLLREL